MGVFNARVLRRVETESELTANLDERQFGLANDSGRIGFKDANGDMVWFKNSAEIDALLTAIGGISPIWKDAVQTRSALPSNPGLNSIYALIDESLLVLWDGTKWIDLTGANAGGGPSSYDDVSIGSDNVQNFNLSARFTGTPINDWYTSDDDNGLQIYDDSDNYDRTTGLWTCEYAGKYRIHFSGTMQWNTAPSGLVDGNSIQAGILHFSTTGGLIRTFDVPVRYVAADVSTPKPFSNSIILDVSAGEQICFAVNWTDELLLQFKANINAINTSVTFIDETSGGESVINYDYYLDPGDGDDANNGLTKGTAWKTADHAIAEIKAIGITAPALLTILGTHTNTVDVANQVDGNWSNNLCVRQENPSSSLHVTGMDISNGLCSFEGGSLYLTNTNLGDSVRVDVRYLAFAKACTIYQCTANIKADEISIAVESGVGPGLTVNQATAYLDSDSIYIGGETGISGLKLFELTGEGDASLYIHAEQLTSSIESIIDIDGGQFRLDVGFYNSIGWINAPGVTWTTNISVNVRDMIGTSTNPWIITGADTGIFLYLRGFLNEIGNRIHVMGNPNGTVITELTEAGEGGGGGGGSFEEGRSFYLNTAEGDDTNDGLSPENAFKTTDKAIENAQSIQGAPQALRVQGGAASFDGSTMASNVMPSNIWLFNESRGYTVTFTNMDITSPPTYMRGGNFTFDAGMLVQSQLEVIATSVVFKNNPTFQNGAFSFDVTDLVSIQGDSTNLCLNILQCSFFLRSGKNISLPNGYSIKQISSFRAELYLEAPSISSIDQNTFFIDGKNGSFALSIQTDKLGVIGLLEIGDLTEDSAMYANIGTITGGSGDWLKVTANAGVEGKVSAFVGDLDGRTTSLGAGGGTEVINITEAGAGSELNAPSHEYYLDAVNGDDSNDGRTRYTPFKTVAHAIDTILGNYIGPPTLTILGYGSTITFDGSEWASPLISVPLEFIFENSEAYAYWQNCTLATSSVRILGGNQSFRTGFVAEVNFIVDAEKIDLREGCEFRYGTWNLKAKSSISGNVNSSGNCAWFHDGNLIMEAEAIGGPQGGTDPQILIQCNAKISADQLTVWDSRSFVIDTAEVTIIVQRIEGSGSITWGATTAGEVDGDTSLTGYVGEISDQYTGPWALIGANTGAEATLAVFISYNKEARAITTGSQTGTVIIKTTEAGDTGGGSGFWSRDTSGAVPVLRPATDGDYTAMNVAEFNSALTSHPPHKAGQVYYDPDTKCLNMDGEATDSHLSLGREHWVRVWNDSAYDLPDGSVVYLGTGKLEGDEVVFNAYLAQADVEGTCAFIGVVTSTILSGGYGEITTYGKVRNLDTSAFADGDIVYVSETTAGALTSTSPAYPNFEATVGKVINVSATEGVIWVDPDTEPTYQTGTTPTTRILRFYNMGNSVGQGSDPSYNSQDNQLSLDSNGNLSSGSNATVKNTSYANGGITPLRLSVTSEIQGVGFFGIKGKTHGDSVISPSYYRIQLWEVSVSSSSHTLVTTWNIPVSSATQGNVQNNGGGSNTVVEGVLDGLSETIDPTKLYGLTVQGQPSWNSDNSIVAKLDRVNVTLEVL